MTVLFTSVTTILYMLALSSRLTENVTLMVSSRACSVGLVTDTLLMLTTSVSGWVGVGVGCDVKVGSGVNVGRGVDVGLNVGVGTMV